MTSNQKQSQRQLLLAKYTSSDIFGSSSSSSSSHVKQQPSSHNLKPKQLFEPKYENITAKERYNRHFGKNIITPNKQPPIIKKQLPAPTPSSRANTTKPLQATDIMCRDMYNNCDTTTYRLRRSKSTFIKRSYIDNTVTSASTTHNDIDARTRCLNHNRSNIFFVDAPQRAAPSSTLKQQQQHKQTTKKAAAYPQKSFTIKRSLYATNTDWRVANTEVPSYKRNKTCDNTRSSNTRDNNNNIRNFKSQRFYNETHSTNLKEKKQALPSNIKTDFNNIESVSYNIISGEPHYKEQQTSHSPDTYISDISTTTTHNNNKRLVTDVKDNYITENYVIDVPNGFNITDINTIKNYFVKEKMHIYGVGESSNPIGHNKGQIKFKIRRNADDVEFVAKMDAINQMIKEKKMKMSKVDMSEVAAKVKQRQKTPGAVRNGEGRKSNVKGGNSSSGGNNNIKMVSGRRWK